MKFKYQVTFKGKEGEKYSVGSTVFEPNVSTYFDVNNIPKAVLNDKVLKIEKINMKEPGDDAPVINKSTVKVVDFPKKVGVVYIGPEAETANVNIQGSFRRDVIRWDLTDNEIGAVKLLGTDFKIIEEEVV